MKYAVEMGSDAMICIPSFIKIGFRHFKSLRLFLFKIREVG
jgi:hypothetical protein